MFEFISTWLTGRSLTLYCVVLFVLMTSAAEVGFRLGVFRAKRRTPQERELSGIGAITGGMLGLMAFTLGLTINFAQERFDTRRSLVVQEANAIGTAWLRSQLIDSPETAAIQPLIEAYAKVQLAYTVAPRSEDEPALVARGNALQDQIWRHMRTLVRREPTTATVSLSAALTEMFDLAQSQRFAFTSLVPSNLSWMLLAGSLLAIGAMGFQHGLAGRRQIVLMSFLLMLLAGEMVLITDLNRPRIGNIHVDPAPLEWTIQGFGK